jgi:hypothetical protein
MEMKLYMVLLGCKPEGRHTEQHDVFFGIAPALKDLIPAFKSFWPEAKGKIHVDGWREVNYANGYQVVITPKAEKTQEPTGELYFINLGGYKKGEFEEFHYKLVIAADELSKALKIAKDTAFFKHTHFEGANAHVDDKYGIDVDDIYTIEEILAHPFKNNYSIQLTPVTEAEEDPLNLGYFKLENL